MHFILNGHDLRFCDRNAVIIHLRRLDFSDSVYTNKKYLKNKSALRVKGSCHSAVNTKSLCVKFVYIIQSSCKIEKFINRIKVNLLLDMNRLNVYCA